LRSHFYGDQTESFDANRASHDATVNNVARIRYGDSDLSDTLRFGGEISILNFSIFSLTTAHQL
jgi:hypothetical protein